MTTQARILPAELFRVPSGMGGSFTVKIISEPVEGSVRVSVHMPGNPDWHGYNFITKRDDLQVLYP